MVVGSAWMPWDRPMQGIILVSCARVLRAANTRSKSSSNKSAACFICTAKQVSKTSEDVMPW